MQDSSESKMTETQVKSISDINSETAKNGYKEEELVCEDLNNKFIKEAFKPMIGEDYDSCHRVTGNHKCDIKSKNNIIKGQVKKYKTGQFQQLDRHWVSELVNNIPELNNILPMLKDLFEYPILPNGTHVDKSKSIKKLCNSNYSQETLDNFLNLLNKFKKQILEYAFLGTNLLEKPEYLFGVEYVKNERKKIVVLKISEVINYLQQLNFKISPRKTAIYLGDKGTISMQRKGGDSGRKSSNQLQFKIKLSNLFDNVNYLEYKFH